MALVEFGTRKKKKTDDETVVEVNFALFKSTKDKYPEFHLPTLIKQQTGKSLDEDNPLGDNEEYRKLEAIAQKFDEKYGPQRDKKGRKYKFGKPEDYMDLGMGYDLEDPFIDDSEGYDELVPSTLTPIHGGFYVNSGPLEFRERSDSEDEGDGPVVKNKTKTHRSLTTDRESQRSGASDTSCDGEPTRHRVTESSDTTPTSGGPPSSPKRLTATNVQRNKGNLVKSGRMTLTPKQKASASLLKSSKGWARRSKNTATEPKRRTAPVEASESRLSDVVDSVIASTSAKEAPASIEDTIQALLRDTGKQRQSTGEAGSGVLPHEVKRDCAATVSQHQQPDKKVSLTETEAERGSSQSSQSSHSKNSPGRMPGRPPTLPAGARKTEWVMPVHLRNMNILLTNRAATETGQFFWTSQADDTLKQLMSECDRLQLSPTQLDTVLDDLGGRMNVKRQTIVRRWEKIKSVPSLSNLLQMFRHEIERTMPELELEHRKMAEETALKKLDSIQNNGLEGERQRNVYTPRRKYVWNDKEKRILNSIVRKACDTVLRDVKMGEKEEALRAWLEREMVPLWPQGWMSARELMKESRDAYSRVTKSASSTETTPTQPTAEPAVTVCGQRGPSVVQYRPQPTSPSQRSVFSVQALTSSPVTSSPSPSKPSQQQQGVYSAYPAIPVSTTASSRYGVSSELPQAVFDNSFDQMWWQYGIMQAHGRPNSTPGSTGCFQPPHH